MSAWTAQLNLWRWPNWNKYVINTNLPSFQTANCLRNSLLLFHISNKQNKLWDSLKNTILKAAFHGYIIFLAFIPFLFTAMMLTLRRALDGKIEIHHKKVKRSSRLITQHTTIILKGKTEKCFHDSLSVLRY